MMAINTRIDVTSNGRRKLWNSSHPIVLGAPGSAPADTVWLPVRSISTHPTNTLPTNIPGIPNSSATRLPFVRSSSPAFNSIMTKTNNTMTAPAYTITCTAATNSAPRRRYSTASDPITTTSESALLMGCRGTRRFTAPATQSAPKNRNTIRWVIKLRARNRELKLSPQCHHQRRHYEIRNRQRQKKLPPESHQLVITKPGQRAAHPYIYKQKTKDPEHKPEHRQQRLQERWSKHRTMPAAQKEQRSHGRDGNHVGVFSHKKHGKLHGAVFSVIPRHQFGLRLRQIERDAVGFRIGRHQINKEGDELAPVKNVPARNNPPKRSALRIHDVSQAEAAGQYEHAHQRESQRNFVTDHLRARPQPAQQRILAVGRPTRERDAVHSKRGDAEDDQQPNVDIRDLQRNVQAADGDPVAHRNHRDRSQSAHDGDDRRRDIQRLVDVRRREVFLEQELDPISQRLQQTERAHSGGSPPVLHVADNFALQPDGVSHCRQQHEECQHSLDERNDDEGGDIQPLFPGSRRPAGGREGVPPSACTALPYECAERVF